MLRQIGVWPEKQAQPIREVLVSQQVPLRAARGDPTAVRIAARDEGVPMLGAVLRYGELAAPLQAAWFAAAAGEPGRLHSRFGQPVAAVRSLDDGAALEGERTESFDLVVVAEGGLFGDQARKTLSQPYAQNAWVGTVQLPAGAPAGVAWECFTRGGPIALLPLRDPGRAALVWCVPRDDDPVAALDDAQRLAVLGSLLPSEVAALAEISPLKCFPLGLNAERTLVDGRAVRIGNAAQTLHPVAGQGLNLGLRDAFGLVDALRRADPSRPGAIDIALRRFGRARLPDRWATIAGTDLLARGFTWDFPGAAAARALGLAAMQALPPLRSALARQLMYGIR